MIKKFRCSASSLFRRAEDFVYLENTLTLIKWNDPKDMVGTRLLSGNFLKSQS